ncbi:c-type cytochrome [Stutzerimonas stutzeri]|uniref:Class I triheme cytochrome c n=1 Tax=Stutzerimonas stutzeri TaxID=316 RepID=A0A172WUG3_STUST|nr:cytochrome c [Stutzerimonas stutzeri]ANF26937.1 class I triheme cytochrome c [Stutzerimonas stutzeri]
MQKDRGIFLKGVLGGAVLAALLGLLLALFVAYTGAYNIAASQDHSPFVRWLFSTTMQNSVAARADELDAPTEFSEAQIAAGAEHYKAMCQHCHAGPGVERAEWAQGLLPQPPHLVEEAAHWQPNEVFWLVKHGVRMSAMPAFGETHKDAELWDVAAFVKQLPGMTASEYAALGQQTGTHKH